MGIRVFGVFFAACTTILAQFDVQEIMRRSVENADRSWQSASKPPLHRLYTKRTEGKRLDAHGVVKSDDVDVENHLNHQQGSGRAFSIKPGASIGEARPPASRKLRSLRKKPEASARTAER
jgi:hypothetical protein